MVVKKTYKNRGKQKRTLSEHQEEQTQKLRAKINFGVASIKNQASKIVERVTKRQAHRRRKLVSK